MLAERVLSGMRPTGALHIGHYHGALKNWVRLQHDYECYFFVADWHALTTHYGDPSIIHGSVWEMLIDWLAAGVDPEKATLFIQSRVIEHAELHLLLSMGTPLGWLERVPTYKDQQDKLADRDLSTYGFLGYPLLQSADILMYQAAWVPVGEDQVPHVELTREVARRFNHLYGREPGGEEKARALVKKMGGQRTKAFDALRTRWLEQGDTQALNEVKALLLSTASLADEDRQRLINFAEGKPRTLLNEPQALLTETAKLPGLDGQKMSKSYDNTIPMRADPAVVTKKIKQMPTDPARARRTDPGNPERCPVWQLHVVYSSSDTRDWVRQGCTSAGIGCLDCKQPVMESVLVEQRAFAERAQPYLDRPQTLREIVDSGCDRARKTAQETMVLVREAMGLSYR